MGLFDLFKKKPEPKDSITVKVSTSVPPAAVDDIPSIKDRVKNAFPSKNGLYPHEILMLEYADSYKTNDNTFQSFWKWNYSVDDPQCLLESLFERGFICFANVKESVKNTKVTELKELLLKKGEKISGKKNELVNRVLEVYNSDELEQIFPEKRYTLTALGQEEVHENEYVLYCHRKGYVTPWEMNALMHNRTNESVNYRDVMWGVFNEESLRYAQNLNFGLYRNVRHNMAEFLVEENQYLRALDFFVEVVAYDLSGLGNNERFTLDSTFDREIRIDSKLANFFLDEEKKEVTIPGGIVTRINKLREHINMSDDDFVNYVYESCSKFKIHNRIFTENECANILLSLMNLEDRKLTYSYDLAVERAKKMIK